MGYYEMKNAMQTAAMQQTKYDQASCEGIMGAILNVYMVDPYIAAEDCVKIFDRFLKTGNLFFRES